LRGDEVEVIKLGVNMSERMKILIGCDGSEYSEKILADLKRAGLPQQAEVLILTGLVPPTRILRGLALDIPFVSPHLPTTPLSQTTVNPTCH
jgi:hypothetical protein